MADATDLLPAEKEPRTDLVAPRFLFKKRWIVLFALLTMCGVVYIKTRNSKELQAKAVCHALACVGMRLRTVG